MAQFVRQSKFRHVYGQPLKKEQCFDNVRITKSAWDGSFCAVNPKWAAVLSDANGSSAFYVIDVSKTGRLDVETPMVSGHKGPVLELQWCPHDDDIIASTGEDCAVKIWRIPSDGLTKNLVDPVVSLTGHQRRVGALVWHPTAANILVSAGQEGRLIVWDVSKGQPNIVFDLPSFALCMSFNFNGTKLAVTCKDKFLRVLDIRAKKILQEVQAHEGSKPSLCTYVRDDRIFTTGFSKMSKRCFSLWNDKDLSKTIMSDEIDSSNGTLFPYYDYDLSLLFLIGKGDSQIRYFEITNEAPYVHYLSLFSSNEPQRGFGYMPKRGVNVTINEVVRIYKMHAKNWVEVIQFMVPRKSEMFQDDLYPDTCSDEPVLTADQWFAGQDAEPLLMSMRDAGRFGPGRPCQNRILTQAVSTSGAASLPQFTPVTTPAAEPPSSRWSANVPVNNASNVQHLNGADSSHASRNPSKEPSPAPIVAPSPKPIAVPRIAVAPIAEAHTSNGTSQNGTSVTTQPSLTVSSTSNIADETDSRTSPNPIIPPAKTSPHTQQQEHPMPSSTPQPVLTPQLHQQLSDTVAGLTSKLSQLTSHFGKLEARLEHVEKLLSASKSESAQKQQTSDRQTVLFQDNPAKGDAHSKISKSDSNGKQAERHRETVLLGSDFHASKHVDGNAEDQAHVDIDATATAVTTAVIAAAADLVAKNSDGSRHPPAGANTQEF